GHISNAVEHLLFLRVRHAGPPLHLDHMDDCFGLPEVITSERVTCRGQDNGREQSSQKKNSPPQVQLHRPCLRIKVRVKEKERTCTAQCTQLLRVRAIQSRQFGTAMESSRLTLCRGESTMPGILFLGGLTRRPYVLLEVRHASGGNSDVLSVMWPDDWKRARRAARHSSRTRWRLRTSFI